MTLLSGNLQSFNKVILKKIVQIVSIVQSAALFQTARMLKLTSKLHHISVIFYFLLYLGIEMLKKIFEGNLNILTDSDSPETIFKIVV